MGIEISTFPWVPPFAQGYVKDIRPRWALAEAGLDYDIVTVGEEDDADYRKWQPFGQVPAYRDDTVELFESGAIVLHIAGLSPALAPKDAQDSAQTQSWVFAALELGRAARRQPDPAAAVPRRRALGRRMAAPRRATGRSAAEIADRLAQGP